MGRVDRRPWNSRTWAFWVHRIEKIAKEGTDLEHKMAKKRAEIEAQLRELESCELPPWLGR